MNWLFPSTLFFLGMSIWLLSAVFATPRHFLSITVACMAGMLFSCGLLWQANYTTTSGIFIAILLFCAIIYGSSFVWRNEDNTTITASGLGKFVGKKTITRTILDPKGTIEVDGQIIPCITEGLFVSQGAEVKIIRAGKDVLIVEPCRE